MIEIVPNIKRLYPKAFKNARKDKMRVVWLEDNLVYVARRKEGHGQYLVRLFAAQGINGQVQVKMRCNTTTGAPCKGAEFNEMCTHMAKVCLRGMSKKAKAERQAA